MHVIDRSCSSAASEKGQFDFCAGANGIIVRWVGYDHHPYPRRSMFSSRPLRGRLCPGLRLVLRPLRFRLVLRPSLLYEKVGFLENRCNTVKKADTVVQPLMDR
jgi:hypothetical protein